MTTLSSFSKDYAAARAKFRDAASRLGWQLEAHPIDAVGPGGEELTVDVGVSAGGDPESMLVISSGVHGVEGFFGSAVQIALLQQWAAAGPPAPRCLFLHGLNPSGFAWLRRFDENNVDPNRNFLLPGERFEGAPEGFAQLDSFLNPQRPPSPWEPVMLKSLGLIARHGLRKLRQAIASGQYEFPRGLFYGGAGPSQAQQILAEHLPRWLAGSKRVIHLDFHTGLGPSGECKLLIDCPLSEHQHDWLTHRFGADAFQACNTQGIAFEARGGFGQWCVSRDLAPNYLFACAEFGTYPPIQVLAGLRAENQAHHWGLPDSASTKQAKQRLVELFCPAAESWRTQVIAKSLELVNSSLEGMSDLAMCR